MWTTSRRVLRAVLTSVVPLVVITALTDVDTARADGSSDRVLVRVGNQAITVGDVERRLAQVPQFQRATYGATPEEITRNYVEKVLVPELLFAQGALDRGLATNEDVQLRRRDLLKSALLLQLREQAVKPEDVKPDEVLRYYEENKERYNSPARYALWRILVANEGEAQKILEEAKKDPTPRTWTELAREHSLDKSSNMRGGNLGFVTDQGTSADGKTRVELSLVEAAKQVKDGEFVDHPVKEGSGFAVVWRRGSMPAVSRSVADEEQTIRRLIARERSVGAQEKLIADLRAKDAKMVNPNAVDIIDVTSTGEISSRVKPGRIDRRPGRTAPRETERGLR